MKRTLAVLALVAGTSAISAGQGRFYDLSRPIEPNPPYDGQFTFARLRYGPPIPYAAQRIPWTHDYPFGERRLMTIMNEITLLRPKVRESSVLAMTDLELFRYPLVYMSEPGFWTMTDEEAAAFGAYLRKGGFAIFDDFAENRGGWAAFESTFHRALPEARFVDLDIGHPIFHSFFEIPSFDIVPQMYDEGRPVFRGVFEQNDPSRRLLAMVNFNTDISEYWELANDGFTPIAESNEAYKLGVNYLIYGMTH